MGTEVFLPADPMATGGSVRLSDASIGALTASLTLLIVTLSVAIVVGRILLRRRQRHRGRHKSRDCGTYAYNYALSNTFLITFFKSPFLHIKEINEESAPFIYAPFCFRLLLESK